MPINFPTTGLVANVTTYSYDGRTWIWTGFVWQSVGTVQGLQGTTGTKGIVFDTVPPANQGVLWVNPNLSSSSIQGATGTQGNVGIQGPPGVQGVQGIQGPTSLPVYDSDQAVISMQVFGYDKNGNILKSTSFSIFIRPARHRCRYLFNRYNYSHNRHICHSN